MIPGHTGRGGVGLEQSGIRSWKASVESGRAGRLAPFKPRCHLNKLSLLEDPGLLACRALAGIFLGSLTVCVLDLSLQGSLEQMRSL